MKRKHLFGMGRMLGGIEALVRINVEGGYYDHLCQLETEKSCRKADKEKIRFAAVKLRLLGQRRATAKNNLDSILGSIIRSD